MPRLSKKQYWKYHKWLKHLWENDISVYAEISPARQRQLHDFFQPSKDLSREELLEHRQRITAEQPNLPHQAGWALKKLQQEIQRPRVVVAPRKYARNVKVTAHPIIRPEIDSSLVAQAYLATAIRQSNGNVAEFGAAMRARQRAEDTSTSPLDDWQDVLPIGEQMKFWIYLALRRIAQDGTACVSNAVRAN